MRSGTRVSHKEAPVPLQCKLCKVHPTNAAGRQGGQGGEGAAAQLEFPGPPASPRAECPGRRGCTPRTCRCRHAPRAPPSAGSCGRGRGHVGGVWRLLRNMPSRLRCQNSSINPSPAPARPFRPLCPPGPAAHEMPSIGLLGRPFQGCRMMTRRAGRLTPAARVEVAHSTDTAPQRYAVSTISRSSLLRPAGAGGQACGMHAVGWGLKSNEACLLSPSCSPARQRGSNAAEFRAAELPAISSAPAWWKAAPLDRHSSRPASGPPGTRRSSSSSEAREGRSESLQPLPLSRRSGMSIILRCMGSAA